MTQIQTNSITKEQIQQHYKENIELFCSDVLGISLYEKQYEVLYSTQNNRWTVVCGGKGVGKTTVSAANILHFLFTNHPCKVLVLSTTKEQSLSQTWEEVRLLHQNARIDLGGTMRADRLDLAPNSWARVLSPNTLKKENIGGYHSPNGVLANCDEMSQMEAETFDMIFGNLNTPNCRFVGYGNPHRTSTQTFYDATVSPLFNCINISVFDTPNYKQKREVIRGLSGVEFVEEVRQKYGEGSDEWLVSVEGVFPDRSAKNAYFKAKVIDEARERTERLDIPNHQYLNPLRDTLRRTVLGVDCSGAGDNETVIMELNNLVARPIKTFDTDSTTALAGYLKKLIKEDYKDIEDLLVVIDITGMGVGTYDILQEDEEIKDKVVGVYVGHSAHNKKLYFNMRNELYAWVKEFLRYGCVEDTDGKLKEELLAIENGLDSDGRLKISTKQEIRKKIGRSTDYADALSLCFYQKEKQHYPQLQGKVRTL